MNYANKAKGLAPKTVRTMASAIAPLAAINAWASTAQLPSGNVTCAISGATGSCTASDQQLGTGADAVQGLSFFTSGTPVAISIGSFSGMVTMEIGAGGPINGPITDGTVIPINVDFDVTTSGLAFITDYDVGFGLGTSLGDYIYGGVGFGGAFSGGEVLSTTEGFPVESGICIGICGGTMVWETVTLTLDVTSSGGEVFVNIPEGASLDYGSVGVEAIPTSESGSLALIGVGLAMMLAMLFQPWSKVITALSGNHEVFPLQPDFVGHYRSQATVW